MMLNEQQYLLICLMEECDEVSQRVAKALRFGLNEVQPGQEKNNAERIRDEINDLLTLVELLERGEVIPFVGNPAAIQAKAARLDRFMIYSRDQGLLA